MWIDALEDRGAIETRERFIERNLAWWRQTESLERVRRRPYYDGFLAYCKLQAADFEGKTVAEVGPGPFGGMIEVCQLPARRKVFIDYIMRELCGLNFIPWPEATYVNAPAERIPLPDKSVDILVSYNALDHGWDIWKSLEECVRISRKCYLAFDCRGDSPAEVARDRAGKDLDHYQMLTFGEVKRRYPSATDMGINSFPVAVVES